MKHIELSIKLKNINHKPKAKVRHAINEVWKPISEGSFIKGQYFFADKYSAN